MESANRKKACIVWHGPRGELDSATIAYSLDDDHAVSRALVDMVQDRIVAPRDSFSITEV